MERKARSLVERRVTDGITGSGLVVFQDVKALQKYARKEKGSYTCPSLRRLRQEFRHFPNYFGALLLF